MSLKLPPERGYDVEIYSVLPNGYEEKMTVREIQEIPQFRGRTILKVLISPPLCLSDKPAC